MSLIDELRKLSIRMTASVARTELDDELRNELPRIIELLEMGEKMASRIRESAIGDYKTSIDLLAQYDAIRWRT